MQIFSLSIGIILFFLALTTSQVCAASEFIFVAKILANDDQGIIVRSNGEAYHIKKGEMFWASIE